jgi:sugar transferase (PEP-CTERM system associated)
LASFQILRSYLKTPFLFLLIVEAGVTFAMVYSANFIRFYADGLDLSVAFDDLLGGAIVVSLVTSICILSTGLYVGKIREGMAGVLIRIGLSLVMSSAIVGFVFYLLPDLSQGRGVLAIAYIQTFFIIGTIRAVFFELVDISTFKSKVLVYGAGSQAAYIDSVLRRKSDRRGFQIIGYVLLEGEECEIDQNKLVNIDSNLFHYVIENQIDEIVITSSKHRKEPKLDELVECKLNGVSLLDMVSFFEREAGQIRIDIVSPEWFVTSDGFNQSSLRDFFKRTFDLLISTIILIVTLPIQLVVICAILIEDGLRAPIIYRQKRTGARGKCFNVYKYRSMSSDAEKAGKPIWASKGDSRVTKIGDFLRKYRLDELPQTINVIKGDMSFVGPRPERPEFVQELAAQIPYYNERHIVKPGLTGWAQLNYPYGSSIPDAYQKQIYDMYYVKNHSLFLDCLILLQTVEVVLFGKGGR